MKKCDCYKEYKTTKYLTDYERGVYFGKYGKDVNSIEVTKCVCAGTKECEECTCGGDITKCDFYPDKVSKYAEKTEKAYQDLLYQMRTQMTSITRYIFNENPKHDKVYKELAKDAVNNILTILNGTGKSSYTKSTVGQDIKTALTEALQFVQTFQTKDTTK